MTGYFKGELRPCECGLSQIRIGWRDDNKYYITCHHCERSIGRTTINKSEKAWNTRPAFDEAIDALMFQITDGVFTGPNTHEAFIETLEKLTGLTYDEALKIYQKRQEEKTS